MSSKIFTLKMHISYYKQAIDTFEGYLDGDLMSTIKHNQAVTYLRKFSPYETLYSTPESKQSVHLHKLKAEHSDPRRKICIRPLDETRCSTQLEDSRIVWSALSK